VRLRAPTAAFVGVGWLACVDARADPVRWNFEGSAAHAVGDPQQREYGVGALGRVGVEVPLGRTAGAQLGVGGLWLSDGSAPANPAIADHGAGSAFYASAGIRLRPYTVVAGPWAEADLGYVRTGDRDRFGFDVDAGYDFRVGPGRWDIGPYVGYLQIVQPNSSLRPEDAHVLALGIHVGWGVERPPVIVAEPPPPPPPEPVPLPPPPPPPPTPPADRDGDGIPDVEDACPDVRGVHTDDPKTNGCPPPVDQVHVVKDRIEYDDVVLFDRDRSHVHHASWPILRKLAQFIVAHPDIEEVDITGHADERGTDQYNLNLSTARALAVKERLVAFGVQADRLTTVGYGRSRPRVEGHTETAWRQNRRVEFIITRVTNGEGVSTPLMQNSPGSSSPGPSPEPAAPPEPPK
jgi:OmpA-OmpF porin, OOP family